MNKQEYLRRIDALIARGKFKDTWESLSQYTVPQWYRNAKFGIFIHWGVYSVPAFGSEWYSRNMYIQGSKEFEHHIKTYGAHKDFGYKDFIPMFKAENFNPDEWAELFKNAGAEYVVPVAEHHDGFQMYKSDISHWNAYEMGPRRDTLGELGESVNKRGMINGASSHRIEHWFFMGHGKDFESDVTDNEKEGDFYYPAMPEPDHFDLFSEPYPSKEFMEDWLVRCCELVDNYNPKIIYFDWWIQHDAAKPYLKNSRRITTTARLSAARRRLLITSTTRLCSVLRCRTWSAVNSPTQSRIFGKRTRPSREIRGAIPRATAIKLRMKLSEH